MADVASTATDRFRVVVWNVASKPAAWALLDGLNPDVALLNEARVPSGRGGIWNTDGTRGRDTKVRRFTSAVITRHSVTAISEARPRWRQNVRDVPFECSRPGAWVAGLVSSEFAPPITVVSLYGLLDEFSDSSVHRSLSELSPLVDDSRYSKYLVIGGDLNTGTQWRSGDPFLDRDRNVLDRFRALGLLDCIDKHRAPGRLLDCKCSYGDECRHVRTRRDPRWPAIPYQTDYLFASSALADRLTASSVLAEDKYFQVSDHAPLVADFVLPSLG